MNEPTLQIVSADPRCEEAVDLMCRQSEEISHRYDDTGDGFSPLKPEDILPGCGIFLIGRLGDQSVACGAFRLLEDKVAEIKRMYVAPDYRRRGYARAILLELEGLAIQYGYDAVRLETGDRQPEAIALYPRCGYLPIAPFGIYATDTRSVCFEKRLK